MSRSLLHVSKLEAFKEWLARNDIAWRGPQGPYQVLQVAKSAGRGWEVVYSRNDMKEHYTTTRGMDHLVERFCREMREAGSADAQYQVSEGIKAAGLTVADVTALQAQVKRLMAENAALIQQRAKSVESLPPSYYVDSRTMWLQRASPASEFSVVLHTAEAPGMVPVYLVSPPGYVGHSWVCLYQYLLDNCAGVLAPEELQRAVDRMFQDPYYAPGSVHDVSLVDTLRAVSEFLPKALAHAKFPPQHRPVAEFLLEQCLSVLETSETPTGEASEVSSGGGGSEPGAQEVPPWE